MALAAPLAISKLGTSITLATPAGTENITASGPLILWIECSAGAGTVTITDPGFTPAGSAATNPIISVGAGVKKAIYLPASVISPSTGQITLTFAVGTFLGILFLDT